MRKYKFKLVNSYIALFRKLADGIYVELSEAKTMDRASEYLTTAQQKAIELGEFIEAEEGEGHPVVKLLEEFCELVYNINEEINSEKGLSADSAKSRLETLVNKIEKSVESDIAVQTLVVFLPYKASMWDSLESVWKKRSQEEGTTALVIPIPYFDRNPDGSMKALHYEADQYPKDVPITSFEDFDFGAEHPDEIYIHNPYDDLNYVTTVHPFFYSDQLKKFTDKLIYIPYFVLAEPDLDDSVVMEKLKGFALQKGVINADEVILQSEKMKEAYVMLLTERFGEDTREIWENKIKGTGSPKFDKILAAKEEKAEIPQEWLKVIEKPDGSHKKIVFYNTSVTSMLAAEDKYLDKIEDVLKVFKENKDDVTLLWRPHPLMESTMESMAPDMTERYKKIVADYKAEGWGIYDETPDMDRSVVISDAYYGDWSSLVQLCEKLEMPIMIQNSSVITHED